MKQNDQTLSEVFNINRWLGELGRRPCCWAIC